MNRKLLIVFSYHDQKEFVRIQRILDSLEQLLDLRFFFEILFSTTTSLTPQTCYPFNVLRHVDPPGEKTRRHIEMAVTFEWMAVARYVQTCSDCDCWFWWEWDVLPVRRDCFMFFMSMWSEETLIMGFHVLDAQYNMKHRINSVAFYSRNYWSFFQPHFEQNPLPFDQVVKFDKKQTKHFIPLNRWFSLIHHERKLLLTLSIRIVHGVKDESLLEQVLGQKTHFETYSDFIRKLRYRIIVLLINLERIARKLKKIGRNT